MSAWAQISWPLLVQSSKATSLVPSSRPEASKSKVTVTVPSACSATNSASAVTSWPFTWNFSSVTLPSSSVTRL